MEPSVGDIFEYPWTIQETDLDSFGHLNNAVYLRILEQARWAFISERGFGLDHIRKSGLGPVILEIQMKFMRELLARDAVVIRSQSMDFKGKVGRIRQWIEKDGLLCFEAVLTVGFWDIHKRKLVPANPEWLRAVGISQP